MTIRWGLWGSGRQAHDLALDFRHVPGAVLHAVASRSAERAQAFAARHGTVRSHAGLAALLADPEVDVVVIASPNDCHADDCLAAIAAGKAVLCEKPFALDAAQAARVVAAARERGVFCMEAMWTRFVPAVAEARRLVAEGRLGRIERIEGDFAYAARPDPADARFGPGGGALLDRGVYLVSLAQQLLGVPTTVQGQARLGPGGVDLHSSYQLGFAGGASAQLWASLTATGRNEFTITGERGQLRLHAPFYRAHRWSLRVDAAPGARIADTPLAAPGLKQRLRDAPLVKALRRHADPLRELRMAFASRRQVFPGNGYQFELQEVTRCLQAGARESAIMPLADTLAVLHTLDRLRAGWADAPTSPFDAP